MTRHIVIIGAARSGTKILRDVLARATGAGAVPYDAGFVWRYGNEQIPHDKLDPETAQPKVVDFIQRYVGRYASPATGAVIEKTVGNTLRVPFVAAVIPGASFVHLIRDGVDVTESARRQWLEPPDLGYLARKLGHFPVRLVPNYGRKYAASLLTRSRQSGSRVWTWGPRYPGIDQDVRNEPLLTVCARQWRSSVEEARRGLVQVDAPGIEVRYEQLISDPKSTLQALLDKLEIGATEEDSERAVALLKPGGIGKGVTGLSREELWTLDKEIGPTLRELQYRSPTERRGQR